MIERRTARILGRERILGGLRVEECYLVESRTRIRLGCHSDAGTVRACRAHKDRAERAKEGQQSTVQYSTAQPSGGHDSDKRCEIVGRGSCVLATNLQ